MNELTKRLAVLITLLGPAFAAAEPTPLDPAGDKLGLFVAAGYLSSPGGHGTALTGGVRIGLRKHLALGFDVGYGVMAASPTLQDRWWIMPSVAAVIPVGRVRFDLGLGFGFGESSAFDSLSKWTADKPVWAFQLIPTLRAHAVASTPLTDGLDLFARVDAASMLIEGTSFGFRDGEPRPGIIDSTWLNLSLGINFRLL